MLIKIISIIGSITFLSRILGYFRDLLIARYFGASYVSDSFFVAFKLPNLFRRLFAEGAMNSAFIPVLSGINERRGQNNSIIFLSKVLSIVLVFVLPVILIIEIFMPFMILFMAPGFYSSETKFELTVFLSRLTLPFLLFVSLSSLVGGFLNTMNKFAAMAFTPIILNMMIIITFITFGSFYNNSSKLSVFVATSISIAGVLQFVWLIINLRRLGFFLKFKNIFHFKNLKIDTDTKKLFLLFIPAVVGNGVYQLNLLIDMILASTLEDGSISFLYFSDRMVQLPLGVLGISLSTALLPTISKHIKQKKIDESIYTTNQCLQIGFIFSIPASFGLFILSEQILDFLFVRGQFTTTDAYNTAQSLKAFSFGLPAFILIKIFSVIFFARENTKTPVYIAFFSLLVNLILNLILINKYFHVGLATATSIAAWFNALTLGYIIVRKEFLIIDIETIKIFLKGLFSSICMTITIIYLNQKNPFAYFDQVEFVDKSLALFSNIFLGILIYLILMYLFKSFYLINSKR